MILMLFRKFTEHPQKHPLKEDPVNTQNIKTTECIFRKLHVIKLHLCKNCSPSSFIPQENSQLLPTISQQMLLYSHDKMLPKKASGLIRYTYLGLRCQLRTVTIFLKLFVLKGPHFLSTGSEMEDIYCLYYKLSDCKIRKHFARGVR